MSMGSERERTAWRVQKTRHRRRKDAGLTGVTVDIDLAEFADALLNTQEYSPEQVARISELQRAAALVIAEFIWRYRAR
jgi:hypothetical protein